MKSFYVGSAKFFEFQCEENLVDKIIEKSKELDFKPAKVFDNKLNNNMVHLGYKLNDDHGHVSFYDKDLYDWVEECLDQVWKNYLDNFKLKICDLWAVKTKFGQTSVVHHHSYSIFSGLLYLTTCEKTNTLFFYPDHFVSKWQNFFSIDKEHNIIHSVMAQKCKLIIWPSDISHQIKIHSEKTDRLTIAFNAFPEGQYDRNSSRLGIKVSNPYEMKFNFNSLK